MNECTTAEKQVSNQSLFQEINEIVGFISNNLVDLKIKEEKINSIVKSVPINENYEIPPTSINSISDIRDYLNTVNTVLLSINKNVGDSLDKINGK